MAQYGKTGDTHLVLTAQDLMLGDVIYQMPSGEWSREIADAAAYPQDDPSAQAALAVAQLDEAHLMGPYLAEVSLDAKSRPTATHFREVFRTKGPSNRFLGKQADHHV